MKRQHLDGYDLYTPQEEPENDWPVTVLIVLGAIVAVTTFYGADDFINDVASLITWWK